MCANYLCLVRPIVLALLMVHVKARPSISTEILDYTMVIIPFLAQ